MKIIGVDAGGTKTLFALFDEQGKREKEVILSTCHYMQVGFDGMEAVLREGIESIAPKGEECFVSFGLAGYGSIQDIRNKIEATVAAACPYPHIINSDAAIGMVGALNNEDGILVIAGTGSIVFAKHGDVTKRYGGWGFRIGDEGSAYFVANKMLNAFSKQSDGRHKRGPLYTILMDALQLKDGYELIPYMNELNGDREKIASLARYCSEAASLNDEDALAIFDESAKELACMLNQAVAGYESEKVRVSYIGGVFKAGEFIMKPLRAYLDSKAVLEAPLFPAEYGAYLLAKQALNK